jgi:hypothetical protein
MVKHEALSLTPHTEKREKKRRIRYNRSRRNSLPLQRLYFK